MGASTVKCHFLKTFCYVLVLLFTTTTNAASSLGVVKQHKVLRVGVKANNPPVSLRTKKGHWQGFAIDMAKSFAAYLHWHVTFVDITGKAVNSILKEGKIDLDMSGTTLMPSIQSYFLVSPAVYETGRVALMACYFVDINQYPLYSLKEMISLLNKKQVKIVLFHRDDTHLAKSLFPKATLLYESHLISSYQLVLKKHADALITDNVTARHIVRSNPGLCIANPSAMFSSTKKVYLVDRKNKSLWQALNLWLAKVNIQSIRANWF